MIFRSSRIAIRFRYVCLPKRQGGLGLVHPKHMATAMNAKIICRLLQSKEELGATFRSGLMESLLNLGFGVSEIYNGKLGARYFRNPNAYSALHHRNPHDSSTYNKHLKKLLTKLSPFWRRIFDSLSQLDMSVHREWAEYTDDEILNLPYDLPGIAKPPPGATVEQKQKLADGLNTNGHRSHFQNLAGFRTFRDILFFHNHARPGSPQLKLLEKRVFWNQLVRISFNSNPNFTPQEMTNIKAEFNHLSKRWSQYYSCLDPKLKERLEAIHYRPQSTKQVIEN